jgi:hypothetical protein
VACQKDQGKLGRDAANVVSDTNVLEEASAAAGTVVRNAGDCDAVKAALPEANRKLDEAAERVRTVTGRETLNALRTRVRNVAEMCP